jgi:hypothetical protein
MRLLGFVITVVLVVAVAIQLLWWVTVAAAVYVLYRRGLRRLWRRHRARGAAQVHRRAEIAARAELQHRWFLDGDPRGTRPIPASRHVFRCGVPSADWYWHEGRSSAKLSVILSPSRLVCPLRGRVWQH